MKKQFLLAVAICCSAFLYTGCSNALVQTKNGFPSVAPGFLISDMTSAAMLEKQVIPKNYKVLGPVEAQAKTVNYVALISMGDASYKTLKKQALEKYPEAKDIINIEIDCFHKNILTIVNEVTVNLRGVAITY